MWCATTHTTAPALITLSTHPPLTTLSTQTPYLPPATRHPLPPPLPLPLHPARYKKPCEQVTAEERSGVKTMVYGLVYGLGIDRLAGALSSHATALARLGGSPGVA